MEKMVSQSSRDFVLDQFVHPHKRVKLGKSYLYFSFGKSPFCSYRNFFNCTRNTFGSGGNPQIFRAVTVPGSNDTKVLGCTSRYLGSRRCGVWMAEGCAML